MTTRESVRARRRQRRRRKAVAAGAVVVLVGGGAGTAWAMNRSSTPRYRLATVTTGTVSQVVAADGSLAAKRVADASFAVSGAVASVAVAVGDRVTAGQSLATMDRTSLDAAVASAKTALAAAKVALTDDEDGTSTTSTATTRSAVTPLGGTGTTGTAGTAVLTAARTSTTPPPASGSSPLAAAQAKVTAAAKALAGALDDELDTVATQCAATTGTQTSTVAAAADTAGTISGSTGSDTTTVAAGGRSVTPASDGSWALTGLTAGQDYTITITQQRSVVDAAKCSDAVDTARDDSSDVAKALTAFNAAVAALQKAAGSVTTGPGNGSTGGSGSTGSGSGSTDTGTGSGSTGTRSGSGSSSGTATTGSSASGSTGSGSSTSGSSPSGSSASSTSGGTTTVTVTSEKLAADVAAVGSAEAALAVAQNQLASAALTSPVTGTVASVGLTTGADVSAGSSSSTIEVVADGPLSVQLSIPLSKIDLLKAGQTAHVAVDGHAASLPAKVTYVGLLNSSSSTGSSSAYTVTVQLDAVAAGLYDGMGAQVSIDVGTATGALVVPLSALHTTGTRQTVDLYRGGTSVPTSVTVGIVGADTVQITSGLTARQQVVLADVAEATPTSSSTATTRGTFGGTFGGGNFGSGNVGGARTGGR